MSRWVGGLILRQPPPSLVIKALPVALSWNLRSKVYDEIATLLQLCCLQRTTRQTGTGRDGWYLL